MHADSVKAKAEFKHMNKKQTSHSTNRHVYSISTYKHARHEFQPGLCFTCNTFTIFTNII